MDNVYENIIGECKNSMYFDGMFDEIGSGWFCLRFVFGFKSRIDSIDVY